MGGSTLRKFRGTFSFIFVLVACALFFQNCSRVAFTEIPKAENSSAVAAPVGNSTDEVYGICGIRQEGEVWEEVTGTVSVSAPGCSSRFFNYSQLTTFRCQAGKQIKVSVRNGRLVSTTGSECPEASEVPHCSGGYSTGQTKNVNEGSISETLTCGSGYMGAIVNTYEQIKTYQCVNGSFVQTVTQRGVLLSASNTCMPNPKEPFRPAYCSEVYLAEICDAYSYLFDRWPDEEGARYWTANLLSRSIAKTCWIRAISFSTSNSLDDCSRHRIKFGFYPNSHECPSFPRRDAPRAVKQDVCPF